MDKIVTTTRRLSIATNSNTLEELIEYENFPVFIGCTDQSPDADIRASMKWMICKESGCIQLQYLMPLDIVYSGYHSEAVGGVWEEHHNKFCKFLTKNIYGNVMEVGGSNGSLANKYCEDHKNVKWTIVEPNMGNKTVKLNENINFVNAFFDKNLIFEKGRTVVCSHVFEHMYEPIKFLEDIAEYLDEGGRLVFSVPNLAKYLENKFSNTINFEHTFFFTEELLEYFLSRNKFKVIEKQYFKDHSIFYSVEKNSKIEGLSLPNQYQTNRSRYLSMLKYYKGIVNALNKNFEKEEEFEFFLFGGSIFSQFVIYLGLNEEKIISIVDNSDEKNGKRLYGSQLYISKPDIISEYKKPTVIVFAGQYQSEIEAQLTSINQGCRIINPKNYLK